MSPDVAKLVRFWLKIKVFGNIFRVIRHLAKFEPILAIVMPLYLLWQKNCYRQIVIVFPTPEISGSNPIMGNFLISTVLNTLHRKDKNNEKRGRDWPNFVKNCNSLNKKRH